jgi:hypothetical protein
MEQVTARRQRHEINPHTQNSKQNKMIEKLAYTVARGRRAGIVLSPHRYADGCFLAHKTNSRNDPEGQRVRSESELIDLARIGYHVRMSNMRAGHPPSTVKPDIVQC